MAYVRNLFPPRDEEPRHDGNNRLPSRDTIEANWDNETKLRELIANYEAFNYIIQANKKTDPAYCEQLMRHIIQFPSVFDAIFTIRADLILFARRASHPLAEIALDFIITNPDEIRRLVKSERDIEVLNKEFKDQCEFSGKRDGAQFTVDVTKRL